MPGFSAFNLLLFWNECMIEDEFGDQYYGCIYLIDNTVNEKIYLGLTIDFDRRKKEHWMGYDKERMIIDASISKHGSSKFNMQIIEYCKTLTDMNEAEEFWIAYYKSIGAILYNIKNGGNNYVMSQSTKDKLSNILKKTAASKNIIAIDYFGNKQYFRSLADACRTLNMGIDTIQDILEKKRNLTYCGYVFIHKKDEHLVDIEELKKIIKIEDARKIYAVDKFGNKTLFNSTSHIKQVLNIESGKVLAILQNKPQYNTIKDYTFIYEDNNKNMNEILSKFLPKGQRKIIAIDKNGNEYIFESISATARFIKTSGGHVRDVLTGYAGKSAKGYTFKYLDKE